MSRLDDMAEKWSEPYPCLTSTPKACKHDIIAAFKAGYQAAVKDAQVLVEHIVGNDWCYICDDLTKNCEALAAWQEMQK